MFIQQSVLNPYYANVFCRALSDLGSADARCCVLEVYHAVCIGEASFSVEVNGPFFLQVLPRIGVEGYRRSRVLPGVLPYQSAAATSEQQQERIEALHRCFLRG